MCGRYTLHTPARDWVERFGVQATLDLSPRFNVAPGQEIPVIRESVQSRELTMLRWGLIPSWAKDPDTGYRMINARAETVASKPAFRVPFRRHRCLIPADGFYEWQSHPGGKRPYYIRRGDGQVFAFAGLWDHWKGADDEAIESCTILVTRANAVIEPIHDRMPVILAPEDYGLWLDVRKFQAERLEALLQPLLFPSLEAFAVSAYVNKPVNDDPHCLEPLSDEA